MINLLNYLACQAAKSGHDRLYALLLFLILFLHYYLFLTIPVRPLISKSTKPIFAKFVGTTMAVEDESDISF